MIHFIPFIQTPEPVVPVSPEPIRPSKLKWRRITPGKSCLVVKDVICLPQGHYLAQEDRHSVPRGQERDELAAMGLIARITIDNSWLHHEMESRLASLFRSRFFSGREQRFTFTYLQVITVEDETLGILTLMHPTISSGAVTMQWCICTLSTFVSVSLPAF